MELVNSCWDCTLDSFSWDVISRTCNSMIRGRGNDNVYEKRLGQREREARGSVDVSVL